MRSLRLSNYEWGMAGVAAFGAIMAATFWPGGVVVLGPMVMVGLVFEALARPLWTLHEALTKSRFTLFGVNLFVGLAWAGVVGVSLGAAAVLEGMVRIPLWAAWALCFGVCGNVVESAFAQTGALRYRLEHPLLAFPFRTTPTLWRVPVTIRAGYFSSVAGLVWGVAALVSG
jgi:hypothetical protein